MKVKDKRPKDNSDEDGLPEWLAVSEVEEN
jgi:hypothetical protein